jgi:hypothetical protein
MVTWSEMRPIKASWKCLILQRTITVIQIKSFTTTVKLDKIQYMCAHVVPLSFTYRDPRYPDAHVQFPLTGSQDAPFRQVHLFRHLLP